VLAREAFPSARCVEFTRELDDVEVQATTECNPFPRARLLEMMD
jgi:hypothetical protein